MLGRWAVCKGGRIGKVTGQRKIAKGGGVLWTGTGLDGKPWQSLAPRFICPQDTAMLKPRTEDH